MFETNRIICGDALTELRKFPDECIDMVITSPPYYGLRNYNNEGQIGVEETFEEYLIKILKITAEIKRVLKKTGQFWLNMGDCYGGLQGKYQGWPDQKLKKGEQLPSHRKPKALSKCLMMIPERLAIKMEDVQEWRLRNKVKWAKQILIKKENRTIGSVMPTSVEDRFNESGEEFYFFTKNKKYYSNLDAVRLPNQIVGVTDLRPNGILRQRLYPESKYNKFNYQGKFVGNPNVEMFNSPKARTQRKKTAIDPNAKGLRQAPEPNEPHAFHPLGKNIPTIWQINPEPHNFERELGINTDHFATFPERLVEIPILFGCPPDGIVLDPFAGSGTTLIVAEKLGRKWIGIEINPDYCELIKKRFAKGVQKCLTIV